MCPILSLFLVILSMQGGMLLAKPASLHIVESGVVPPGHEDIGLQFYVMVENKAWYPMYDISVEMDRCCLQEELTGDPTNCETMFLFGDNITAIEDGEKRNLTLVYPTMYVFDRAGECDVTVTHGEDEYHIQHTIHFDTALTEEAGSTWVPDFLEAWLKTDHHCESIDQDRLRGCEPVNCALKYHGLRNYYNTSSKKCQPPTSCLSDPEAELPNKAFNRKRNTCKDLELKLTQDDAKQFEGEEETDSLDDFNLVHMYQTFCVHGKETGGGTGCICDKGWTTGAADHSSYNPTTRMYYMCNVREGGFGLAGRRGVQIALIVLGSICGMLLFAFLSMLGHSYWRRQRGSARSRTLLPSRSQVDHMGSFGMYRDDPSITAYAYARVHTPCSPLVPGSDELELRIGDIITDLQKTEGGSGMWKGTCNGKTGTFPVCCAEFFQDGQGSLSYFSPQTPASKFSIE